MTGRWSNLQSRRFLTGVVPLLSMSLVAGFMLTTCGCEKEVAGPDKSADVKPSGERSNGAVAEPQSERVKAEFGVGAKGKSGGSPIRQTVNAYFNSAERLRFLAVEHALNLYKASDPNGRGPKSHEEFMEKIVEFNQLQLPELPEGHRYVYDPEAGELMVERPAAQ